MTDTVESVLAEMPDCCAWNRIPQDEYEDLKRWIDRLAAAHAAEVAGLEANLRNLSPLNYEERCRLRDAEARIAELTAHAADRESEIETIKFERKRAEDEAEAAERDAGMLRDTLRECLPYVDSHAKASHLTDGFKPQPANKHDELAARVSAIATTEQADEE